MSPKSPAPRARPEELRGDGAEMRHTRGPGTAGHEAEYTGAARAFKEFVIAEPDAAEAFSGPNPAAAARIRPGCAAPFPAREIHSRCGNPASSAQLRGRPRARPGAAPRFRRGSYALIHRDPGRWHDRCPGAGAGVRIRSRFREVQGTAPNGQRQGSRLRILPPNAPGRAADRDLLDGRRPQRAGRRAVIWAVSRRVGVVRSSRRSRNPASLSSSRSPRAKRSQS